METARSERKKRHVAWVIPLDDGTCPLKENLWETVSTERQLPDHCPFAGCRYRLVSSIAEKQDLSKQITGFPDRGTFATGNKKGQEKPGPCGNLVMPRNRNGPSPRPVRASAIGRQGAGGDLSGPVRSWSWDQAPWCGKASR